MTESAENIRIREQFDFDRRGFYDVTPYIDTPFGFSFKKKFLDNSDYISLISLYVPKNTYEDTSISKKPIYISAMYGKQTDGGVYYRTEKVSLSDPLDVEFRNEYFYNIETGKLLKGEQEINPNDLLDEIYEKHIKNTKLLRGLFLRFKIKFWRDFISWIFDFISKIFYYFLFIVSGDRYSYEYFLKQEKLNGRVIKSEYKEIEEKEELRKSERIDFFGLKVSRWSIIFYSILHLGLYGFFIYKGFNPIWLKTIFKNNFLTVLYVVLSFWIIEVPVPYFLKLLIKGSSTLSSYSRMKNVKI